MDRQTFNKRFAIFEKSPIFQSHKSYSNPLDAIERIELILNPISKG